MNKFAIAYTSRCNRPQTPEIFNIKSLKKAPMCIPISLHFGLRSDGYEIFLTPALFIDFQQLIVKGLVQGNRMSLPCMLIFPQTGWALNRF